MIKLKSLYEVQLVRPLRLNAKGVQLLKDYNEFHRLANRFDIPFHEDDGNDDYNLSWDIGFISDSKNYSKNGITHINLIKDYLIKEYGFNKHEEDYTTRLKDILQYFS